MRHSAKVTFVVLLLDPHFLARLVSSAGHEGWEAIQAFESYGMMAQPDGLDPSEVSDLPIQPSDHQSQLKLLDGLEVSSRPGEEANF